MERLSGDLITTIDHKHDTVTEPGQAETTVILGMFPKEGTYTSFRPSGVRKNYSSSSHRQFSPQINLF